VQTEPSYRQRSAFRSVSFNRYFLFVGKQEDGRDLRFATESDVQQTAKFDADPIPQHQSANAAARVRQKAASIGLRI